MSKMNSKFVIWVVVLSVAVLTVGVVFFSKKDSQVQIAPESDVVVSNGIHWHPKIKVFVKGQEIPLEKDIGRKGFEQPIHTHEEDYQEGIIHLEFKGLVKKEDVRLGEFFRIWGKEFDWSETTRMTVNGVENKEFQNYLMKDKDEIEVRFD